MPPNRNKGNAPRCMEDFVWDEAARSDRLLVLRRDPQPHRDHRRFDETVMPEKFLGDVLRAIGQKCDAQKILLSGKFDGVIQQLRPVTFALILVVNDQIFEQDHKPALGCADGEKKVDHPNDGAVAAQHKNTAPVRLFEDEAEAAERSEEHTSELQSRFGISYAVFCLKKK